MYVIFKFYVILQNEEYCKKAIECLDNSMSLLNSADWKVQKRGNIDGDIVESMETEKFGKIYLMTVIYFHSIKICIYLYCLINMFVDFQTILECPSEFLFDEFSNKVEELHKWNPTILESIFIQVTKKKYMIFCNHFKK